MESRVFLIDEHHVKKHELSRWYCDDRRRRKKTEAKSRKKVPTINCKNKLCVGITKIYMQICALRNEDMCKYVLLAMKIYANVCSSKRKHMKMCALRNEDICKCVLWKWRYIQKCALRNKGIGKCVLFETKMYTNVCSSKWRYVLMCVLRYGDIYKCVLF